MVTSLVICLLAAQLTPPPQISKALEAKVSAVTDEFVDWRAGVALRERFDTANENDRRALEFHANSGIAMAAAWDQIRRGIPEKPRPPKMLEPALVQRFLGFVEGRIRAPLPQFWTAGIKDAKAYGRSNVKFPVPELDTYHDTELPFRDSKLVMRVADGASVESDVTGTSIVLDGMRRRVPNQIANQFGRNWQSHVVSAVGTGQWYLALHADSPFLEYRLFCIQVDRVAWTSSVWGAWLRIGSGGGGGHHRVEITEFDGQVFVFGVAGSAAYIEAFKSSDGAEVFRFMSAF